MNYPEQILPQLNFKIIIDDLSQYLICRKFLNSIPSEDAFSIIPEEILGLTTSSDCFDYSTNLPGVFEFEFNKIELKGDNKKTFRSYWDQISVVNIPKFDEDFFINDNIKWFFLSINKISSLKVPFKRNGSQTEEHAYAVVIHTPTNCNFWHFSIKWKTGHEFISTTDSKWKNPILATVRASLSEFIEWSCPSQQLPASSYTKN